MENIHFVIFESRLNIFGFWTVFHTKRLWKIIMCIFQQYMIFYRQTSLIKKIIGRLTNNEKIRLLENRFLKYFLCLKTIWGRLCNISYICGMKLKVWVKHTRHSWKKCIFSWWNMLVVIHTCIAVMVTAFSHWLYAHAHTHKKLLDMELIQGDVCLFTQRSACFCLSSTATKGDINQRTN